MIKAIDLHCHYNYGAEIEAKEDEIFCLDIPFLKNERTRLEIKALAASSFASVMTAQNVFIENEKLYKISQSDDFIYQWVVIDPRDERTFLQVRRMLKEKKTLGIKIHPIFHQYSILEYGRNIFSFANDYGAVVLMHPEHIMETVKIVNEFPEMKLILAHLGGVEWVQAIENAKHGNVYADTSGNASCRNNVIEYTVKKVGSEKIFFGTDAYSCAFQRGRIDYADISELDKENILYKNAQRVFPNLQNL